MHDISYGIPFTWPPVTIQSIVHELRSSGRRYAPGAWPQQV
uniref:Uncharacterized protein n=1 Tax=Anguilla anguilla TaxID=7936 RepID=A0A0E9RV26_ANGAN